MTGPRKMVQSSDGELVELALFLDLIWTFYEALEGRSPANKALPAAALRHLLNRYITWSGGAPRAANN